MTADGGAPAGWYDDPLGVGELRYHDGTHWTEHVVVDGVQTTSAVAGGPASFRMSRAAQWRSEDEKPLEVTGSSGSVGRFVAELTGVPGYRLVGTDGGTLVVISKPSLKTAVEVTDPAGYPVATITRVGRLHSRYDISTPRGDHASAKLVSGSDDSWELHVNGAVLATVHRTISTDADALNFAAVEYTTTLAGRLAEVDERLVLALPVAIDMLDSQALPS